MSFEIRKTTSRTVQEQISEISEQRSRSLHFKRRVKIFPLKHF